MHRQLQIRAAAVLDTLVRTFPCCSSKAGKEAKNFSFADCCTETSQASFPTFELKSSLTQAMLICCCCCFAPPISSLRELMPRPTLCSPRVPLEHNFSALVWLTSAIFGSAAFSRSRPRWTWISLLPVVSAAQSELQLPHPGRQHPLPSWLSSYSSRLISNHSLVSTAELCRPRRFSFLGVTHATVPFLPASHSLLVLAVVQFHPCGIYPLESSCLVLHLRADGDAGILCF